MTLMTDFDAALAGGDRRSIGIVGVDGGVMMLAAVGRFRPDELDGPIPAAGDGWVISGTGYGDGGYDVVEVVHDGEVTGVEVVFLCPEVDAACDSMLDELMPRPTMEERLAFADGSASADLSERVSKWEHLASTTSTELWDTLALTVHPADSTVPQVLGDFAVAEAVEVGDPCYGSSSKIVAVPAGSYRAVAWNLGTDGWGDRTARLGLYRIR